MWWWVITSLNYSHIILQTSYVTIKVCSIIDYNKSSSECADMLHWCTLPACRNYWCVSTLHDIFSYRTSLNFSDYYFLNNFSMRSQNLIIVPLQSTIKSYRFSFFVSTAFSWNNASYVVLSKKSEVSFCCALYQLFCT